MTYKLKALGLALVAAFAMSAAIASVAQGHAAFTADKVGATITGTQTAGAGQNIFMTTHGALKCSTAVFHGVTTEVEATEIKLTATYSGCKIATIVPATVDMTGCYYRITAGETKSSESTISAIAHVECPAGASIDINVNALGFSCQITVRPQTFENGITLHNSGTSQNMDILAIFNVTDIDYTIDNPTKCPNFSDVTNHTEENFASYKGEVTISAEEGNPPTPVNITVH